MKRILRAGLCMDKDEMFLKPAEADATICAISTAARRRVCNMVSLKWWSNHEYIRGENMRDLPLLVGTRHAILRAEAFS